MNIDINMTHNSKSYRLVPDGSGECKGCAFYNPRSFTTCKFGFGPPEWNHMVMCSDLDGHWEEVEK